MSANLDLGSEPGALRRIYHRFGALFRPSDLLDAILEEQFNRLCHAARHHSSVADVRAILVTSAVEGEGKTAVATGLARSFARSLDHAALLVETDLRRPTLAARFELPPGPGLVGHIIDGTPLEAIIQNTQIPKLAVVQAGARVDAAAQLVGSSYMRRFAQELRRSFPDRVVIFDAPPVLATPEPLSLSLVADGIVFVVRAEATPRELVRQALRALPPEKVLGIAVNAVPFGSRDRRALGSYGEGYAAMGAA